LVASSHYMLRWLPSPRALNNYVEKFELRAIVPPSTLNYVVLETDEEGEEVMPLIEFDLGSRHYRVTLEQLAEQWNLVYHGAKFTGGITADEKWGEYNRLVGLQSLQYEDPRMDVRNCDLITIDLVVKIGTIVPNAKSMRVANMARDEKIDKILESISRIETMMTQLNLNNDFKTPTKFSSQKRHPFPNRLKAKSSDIDIHTTISDDEDDLIELDKGSFTHDDAFNIKINIDKPVFPTVRTAMKKKNISKGKTIMGIQKKLPFTLPGGVRKPKIEPKSFNKFKVSYALSKPIKDYRRPVYFFSITNCEFMPTPTMRLLKDQIKACVYAFSASLDSSEKLVVTDTIRATRSDFDHFVPDRPIIDKILELVSLRCTDEQSDINFKTTWQLPSRFV
ncbi:hypothetical protein S245_056403, partial [Arachis hypogaea]